MEKKIYPKVVVIVHYNTPTLTAACIRSLEKHTHGTHIIVFDNSDKRPFVLTKELRGMDIEILDNTRGQLIDFKEWLKTFPDKEPSPGNDYGSAKHCYSVQWVMDHRKQPFMLMDSDVLIRKDIGPLFGLWFQSSLMGIIAWALSICIFIIVYGRMIEIYMVTSIAPIPMATMANREWGQMGQNYLRSLFALGFQAFLIMVCVGIYAVLIKSISIGGDVTAALWTCLGYTVLLCFTLFKSSSVAKSIFNAH